MKYVIYQGINSEITSLPHKVIEETNTHYTIQRHQKIFKVLKEVCKICQEEGNKLKW